ncbi:MAG: hypothetical protein NDI73_07700 [Desulfuromonadales bacterium]|nr:hypothetical protein [Desulfuromonadales bacterium]
MFRIVDKPLTIEYHPGHHLHCLVCQIPNRLGEGDTACRLIDPEPKWAQIRSILDLVAAAEGNLRKLHFLVFPEACLPFVHLDEMLDVIRTRFRTNTVTIFGIEHIKLRTYLALLRQHAADNAEVLASVQDDVTASDIEGVPVNCCVTAVKEADGTLRVFFQAKSHPFFGEETIDPYHDLYRGKVFPLFRCAPTGFNFMPVICLDYVYRDLYQSNISTIIERANQLFYQTRQRLDLLCVLECNPKPEHRAFRDVVNGFYGEYLAYTPGVRETTTVFCNSSGETTGFGDHPDASFGHSMVILHRSHKLAAAETGEFRTDDFDGLPVCRLRLGTETRLCYFNLPLFHELDPRTTRYPLKIHSIYRPDGTGWTRLGDLSPSLTAAGHDFQAVRQRDAAEPTGKDLPHHD